MERNKPKTVIKHYDSELLEELANDLITDYNYSGAFSDYNGMDVRNLINPIFNKLK